MTGFVPESPIFSGLQFFRLLVVTTPQKKTTANQKNREQQVGVRPGRQPARCLHYAPIHLDTSRVITSQPLRVFVLYYACLRPYARVLPGTNVRG